MSAIEAPGRSVRPIEPANSTSPENRIGSSAPAEPEHHRPGTVPGRVESQLKSSPATMLTAPSSGSSRTSSGSAKVSVPNSGVPTGMPTHVQGSASCGPVARVDERRYVAGLADRKHGERVVEVTVGEQHGDRVQAVLRDDLVESAPVTPMPGSMTTHCSPAAEATT